MADSKKQSREKRQLEIGEGRDREGRDANKENSAIRNR